MRLTGEPGQADTGPCVSPVVPGQTAVPSTGPPPTELPHWTEPPTGQVPAVLARDSADDTGSTLGGPSWREEDADWVAHEEEFEPAMFGDDEVALGSLDESEGFDVVRRPWEFDLDILPAAPHRTGRRSLGDADDHRHHHRAHHRTGGGGRSAGRRSAVPVPAMRAYRATSRWPAQKRRPRSSSPRVAPSTGRRSCPTTWQPRDGDDGGCTGGRRSRSGSRRARPAHPAAPTGSDRPPGQPTRSSRSCPPVPPAPPGGTGPAQRPAPGPPAGQTPRRHRGAHGHTPGRRAPRGRGDRGARRGPQAWRRGRAGRRRPHAPAEPGSPAGRPGCIAETHVDMAATAAVAAGVAPRRPKRQGTAAPPRPTGTRRPDRRWATAGTATVVPRSRDGRPALNRAAARIGLRVGTGLAAAVVALAAFKLGTVTSLVLCLVVVTFAAGECFSVLRKAATTRPPSSAWSGPSRS